MHPEDIRKTIEARIPDAKATVVDLTGGGDHFQAEIVSIAFAGKPIVQQHKMVYALFERELTDGSLHALSLKTRVPPQPK